MTTHIPYIFKSVTEYTKQGNLNHINDCKNSIKLKFLKQQQWAKFAGGIGRECVIMVGIQGLNTRSCVNTIDPEIELKVHQMTNGNPWSPQIRKGNKESGRSDNSFRHRLCQRNGFLYSAEQ